MSPPVEGALLRARRPDSASPATPHRIAAATRNQWLTLFVATRVVGVAVALLLLTIHRITPHDEALALLVLAYGAGSILAAIRWQALQRSAVAWTVDCAAALGFVLAGQDWRSAFYLLALSTLVLPATTLGFRAAVGFAALFDVGYLTVAVVVGVDWHTVDSTARLESFSTHLMVPLLVGMSLAYAAELLERLRAERLRAERLALEAERRRIAWELHDSAKQRIHAANLVLSAVDDRESPVEQARAELRAAVADMDRSLRDLRSPLPVAGVLAALRLRARELAHAGGVEIAVNGEEPPVSPMVAAHTYRIATEAMTNAVRHAGASRIAVRVDAPDGALVLSVSDDGHGVGTAAREGSGLLSMRGRAREMGADLRLLAGAGGRGTEIRLILPRRPSGVEDPA